MTWVVVPAAGRGTRLGGDTPKQYLTLLGQPMIERTLRTVLSHPQISGVVVAIAHDDTYWPGWREFEAKPVVTCHGGGERSESVLSGLLALPATVNDDDWVLVHDAARPCLSALDLSRLLAVAQLDPVGAILAAPVTDTLKRTDADSHIIGTEPRNTLWRAFTPQCFRRGSLTRALESALRQGITVTDEAQAMERLGLKPRLVPGSEDNIKVTSAFDLKLAEFILSRS